MDVNAANMPEYERNLIKTKIQEKKKRAMERDKLLIMRDEQDEKKDFLEKQLKLIMH